jgi:predicted XRE-type DNA-binding protein
LKRYGKYAIFADGPGRGGLKMAEIPVRKSSGNVFADMGYTPVEAAELTAKSRLITAIGETIKRRKLTQLEAARRCGTDQPTLSKVLRGRMESVTFDRLTAWLMALGRTVEIRIRPYDAKAKTGHLLTTP